MARKMSREKPKAKVAKSVLIAASREKHGPEKCALAVSGGRHNLSDLARFFGLGIANLHKHLQKSGAPKKDAQGLYDALAVAVFLRLGENTETVEVTRADMALIKAAGMELDNERKEIENAVRLNELVEIGDAVDVMRGMAAIVNGIGKELYGIFDLVAPMAEGERQRELGNWWKSKMQTLGAEVETFSDSHRVSGGPDDRDSEADC